MTALTVAGAGRTLVNVDGRSRRRQGEGRPNGELLKAHCKDVLMNGSLCLLEMVARMLDDDLATKERIVIEVEICFCDYLHYIYLYKPPDLLQTWFSTIRSAQGSGPSFMHELPEKYRLQALTQIEVKTDDMKR